MIHNDYFCDYLTLLDLQGERLDLGCSAGDYEVTVGGGDCVILELRTNQLVCRPPETKPDLGTYHKDGAPRVKVSHHE